MDVEGVKRDRFGDFLGRLTHPLLELVTVAGSNRARQEHDRIAQRGLKGFTHSEFILSRAIYSWYILCCILQLQCHFRSFVTINGVVKAYMLIFNFKDPIEWPNRSTLPPWQADLREFAQTASSIADGRRPDDAPRRSPRPGSDSRSADSDDASNSRRRHFACLYGDVELCEVTQDELQVSGLLLRSTTLPNHQIASDHHRWKRDFICPGDLK